MKIKYTVIPLLIAGICFASCGKNIENEIETVKLDNIQPKEVAVSQFTTGVDVVQLETTDDCLISFIRGFECDDESIYILDGIFEGVYVFDRTGKYKRKLNKQGRGAGEYMVINGFAVNQKEQTIEVFDENSKKILIYELGSFKFVKEISVPLSIAFGFEKNDGIYYFQTNRLRNTVDGEKTNSDIIAFDPKTNTLTPLFDEVLPDEVNRTFSMKGISKNAHKQLFYSRAWHDQFYRIEKQKATPFLTIDAGKYSVSDDIKKGTFEQQEEYMDSEAAASHYLLLRLALYDTTRLIITFSKGARPFDTHCYMRFGDETYLANKIILDNIKGTPELSLNNAFVVGNSFIYKILPGESDSPDLKSYLDSLGVRDQDNPVLLIYSIK